MLEHGRYPGSLQGLRRERAEKIAAVKRTTTWSCDSGHLEWFGYQAQGIFDRTAYHCEFEAKCRCSGTKILLSSR